MPSRLELYSGSSVHWPLLCHGGTPKLLLWKVLPHLSSEQSADLGPKRRAGTDKTYLSGGP